MSWKLLQNRRPATASRPISLRLALADIERLQARAHTVSGTLTGIARDLILTGLAGGDNKAIADRLMLIERRLSALECLAHDVGIQTERIEAATRDLHAKFDALLTALSSGDGASR
jgi:hypothetical protein